MGSHKTIVSNIHQNQFFTFSICWTFLWGISPNVFWTLIKIGFSHSFDLLIFFIYPQLSYFYFLLLFCTMDKDICCLKNNWKYPFQHSRNLLYRLQLLMHYLQVIIHEHLSRLDLIINTLPKIITRTTSQINMTSSHVWHYKNKITLFRPHIIPIIWIHWMINCLFRLISYTQQLNCPPAGK